MKNKTISFLVLIALVLGLTGLAGCYDNSYKKNESEDIAEELDLDIEEGEDQEAADQADDVDDVQKAVEDVADGTQDKTADEIIGKIRDQAEEEKTAEQPEAGAETAPAAKGATEIKVTEGDLVQVKLQGKDPDGDVVTYSYGKPFDATGKWQTRLGNEGTYNAEVMAQDSKGAKSVKTLKITVLHKNRAPSVKDMKPIIVNEGEIVKIAPEVNDPESAKVELAYSGWMTSDTYQTGYEDSGEHIVTVTASDGKLTSKKDVKIMVNDVNRAPEFDVIVQ